MLSCLSHAQNYQQHCGTKYETSWETPEFDLARLPGNSAAKPTATYYIPTVFHVIHDAGPENVSAGIIQSALNKLNAEYANQSPYDDTDGVDIGIQFCLAVQDTDGHTTTGIVRHQNEATDFDAYITDNGLPANYPVDSLIKDLYHWPTDKYLNIYIVRSMGFMSSSSTMPDMYGNFKDGIMIVYNTMMGAGLPHESGHYLGLYHTFQNGCTNNDCLNDNDKVCDTPPDNLAEYNLQNCIVSTCSSDTDDATLNNPFRSTTLGGLGDQNDDTRNFMDLSACQSKYTPGQKARMVATLTTIRGSLLTSQGCQPTSVSSVVKNEIAVYPNPVTDLINIEGARNCTATLFNTLGQQVYKDNVKSDSHAMNLDYLQTGVYMLVVTNSAGEKNVMRILKQ